MALVLFTDFGSRDLYIGQVKARLYHFAQAAQQIDLFHDAPGFNVKASAHLLTALASRFSPGNVFLAVVDPGVGSARDAVVVLADGNWLVGPDNGLLSVHASRAKSAKFWRIDWRPPDLSKSFHGRDLFVQIAAEIAKGEFPTDKLSAIDRLSIDFGSGDLGEIIWIDHYGNAITGLARARREAKLAIGGRGGRSLAYAEVFSSASPGEPFWYHNSMGLAEIAVNQDSAAQKLGLRIGDAVSPG